MDPGCVCNCAYVSFLSANATLVAETVLERIRVSQSVLYSSRHVCGTDTSVYTCAYVCVCVCVCVSRIRFWRGLHCQASVASRSTAFMWRTFGLSWKTSFGWVCACLSV